MNRDRRFFVGLVGVAAIVGYLVWTGITETMVYYLTPTELVSRVEADPGLHQVGFKVSGNVVPGSYQAGDDELIHRFVVADQDNPDMHLSVEFRHPLPDTFQDDGEVVMEGRFREDRVFEASEVLTKCGSRYEAMPEEHEYYESNGEYDGDGYQGGDYEGAVGAGASSSLGEGEAGR